MIGLRYQELGLRDATNRIQPCIRENYASLDHITIMCGWAHVTIQAFYFKKVSA